MANVGGYNELPLQAFAGLNTLLDPTNLPPFLSPDTQDCEYVPGLVRTRPGLTSQFAPLAVNPTVNYLKTYINLLIQNRLLALDGLGNLYKENPQGTLNLIGTIEKQGLYGNSVSLFGKEFMAFGDMSFGQAIPRQYDDTNFDRVSQVGPGAGPTVTDFLPPAATISNPGVPSTINIAAAPTGAVRSGLVDYTYAYTDEFGQTTYSEVTYYTTATIETATPHGLSDGTNAVIDGVTDSTFDTNGIAVPISLIDATHFSYMQFGSAVGGTTSGSGTVQPVAASVSRSSNILTFITSPAHGFKAGWTVVIAGTGDEATGGAATAVRQTGVTTVTTATPHGLPVGSPITIQGMSDTSYNGPFTVSSVPTPTSFTVDNPGTDGSTSSGTVNSVVDSTYTIRSVPDDMTFTVNSIGNDFQASPTSATATIQGNVVAGTHQVSVSFITRETYTTPPSPPVTFVAGGGKLLALDNIPTGPPNIQQRVLMFTSLLPANGTLGSFYTIEPQMIIIDNTSTSAIVDFSDDVLLTGTLQDPLFDLEELGECSGVTEYNERLFWWGERNKLQNFVNLTFDGGFGGRVGGFPGTYPLGWTRDPTYGTGGQEGPNSSIWGEGWTIIGDGVTALRGMITQGAFQDAYNSRLLVENTAYSVRVYLLKQTGMIRGNVVLDIYVPSTNAVLGSFTIPEASISTVAATEFIGALLPSIPVIPQDAVLRLYASDTPTSGKFFFVDNIEIFPSNAPYITTTIRASEVDEPESYVVGIDGSGLITVAPENGQAITCVFRIRNYLYPVKTQSLYVTADNGNEPDSWDVNEVSDIVGTPSPRGVGLGDEWAVIAGKKGLYYFTGQTMTDANKFSQEIQPTWDRINWQYGQLVDVKVDTVRKRIYVAVPMDSATICNKMLVLDYVEGFGDPLGANGVGRKWSIWNIPCNSMNFILRNDGEQPLFIGNNVGNGLIYSLDSTNLSDNGAAIDSYWQSGFFQDGTRLNFGYLVANIQGSGACGLIMRNGNQQFLKVLRGWVLKINGFFNMERQIQLDGNRAAFRFETNAAGNGFSLQGLGVYVQQSAFSPYRGINQ